MDAYLEFLQRKIKLAQPKGFEVELADIHPVLWRHQPIITQWAIRGGCRAIFAAFGLGKTLMQAEYLRQIQKRVGGPALVVLPLGVRQEFKIDGAKLGMEFQFIQHHDAMRAGCEFYLTNYESVREGKVDPTRFCASSLDEAAVLRSFGSDTFQTFLPLFAKVPFKLVATAMPAPNRYKELIHYAAFLGIMDSGQALTRFFQRDSTQANNLTIYPHKEREFWLWVHSWAVFISKPSDLGFSDEGYTLPPLDVRYHEVATNHALAGEEKDGQARLFKDAALGLRDAASEKRDSLPARVECMTRLVNEAPEDHFILWHDLEDERQAIQAAVPEAVAVYGSQGLDEREEAIINFSNGRFRVLSAKPIVAGSGCNFQRHCHRAIFVGIGYKFHDFLQAIHRILRFLQPHQVRIDIIYSEAEREILKDLLTKWAQHNQMVEKMTEIIKEHGLNTLSMQDVLSRTIGVERIEVKGELFQVANNDTVIEARGKEADSIDLMVTSIPFANHYEYTPSYNDFGHTESNAHFWEQMDFLTPELFRILRPGRIAAIHVKNRINFGNVTGLGFPTEDNFLEETSLHFQKHGFKKLGIITVVTDVVRENNQTYRLGWSEQCKDGSKMGVGCPEYIVIFRKPQTDRARGYADVPVTKDKADYTRAQWQVDAHAFWRSSGNRLLTPEEMAKMGPGQLAKAFTEFSLQTVYDYEFHVRIGKELDRMGALPSSFMSLAPGSQHPSVWHDVNRMITLNGNQTSRGLQNHVCLARDSLVLTNRGHIPIQHVQVGDTVLTHKGRWRKVIVARKTGIRPVVTIRAQGVPGLTLTPDHKLWSRIVPKNAGAVAHSRASAKMCSPRWEEAANTLGSYINQKTPPESDLPLTDQELWLVGRWIADGHVETRGGYVVSIGSQKLARFREMAGHHAGGESVHTATQIRLIKLSKAARELLSEVGSGASHKEFPSRVLALPGNRARMLLDGYLSGDGHYLEERNRWTASTVSKKLALGLSLLAQQAYGVVASVYPGRSPGTTVIEGRTVNTLQDWVVCFDMPNRGGRKLKPFLLEDGAWKKVRKIEPAGEAETWCLRVEEDESFTAEGCLVKNCPLQIDIVDRLINRYSMPGELVYDPFGGLMTVPYRAIKLGRLGAGVELNTQYFFDGVHYCKAAEAEHGMPTLFDLAPAEAEAA